MCVVGSERIFFSGTDGGLGGGNVVWGLPQQAKQQQAEKAAAAAKAEAEAVEKEKKKAPRTSGFFDDEPEHLNGRMLQQRQEFEAKVRRCTPLLNVRLTLPFSNPYKSPSPYRAALRVVMMPMTKHGETMW